MTEIAVEGLGGRTVLVGGVGLICSAGVGRAGVEGGQPGEVPDFNARHFISDRKSIKIMSRAVQLGVSASCLAAGEDGQIDQVSPERRGMFVGARAQAGEPSDLQRAFDVSWGPTAEFDLHRFARAGIERIHPLWLIKGLSNNVLGLTSAALDIQGWNSSYCHGEEGGWTAILEGARAVAEGRADWVLAGGSDSLVGAERILDCDACGEAGAFIVFRSGPDAELSVRLDREELKSDIEELGVLGAATWPVALARRLLRGAVGL